MEKITFILVDDDSTSSLIAEFNIRKVFKHANVKVFGNAEIALAFIMAARDNLQSQGGAFLLTDLNMPGMDGIELIERLIQWDPNIGEILHIYILSVSQEMVVDDLKINPVVRGSLTKPLDIADVQSLSVFS